MMFLLSIMQGKFVVHKKILHNAVIETTEADLEADSLTQPQTEDPAAQS